MEAVGNRSNRGPALNGHHPDLSRRKPQVGHSCRSGFHHLGVVASRASQLTPLPGRHLNVVNDGANGNTAEGKAISDLPNKNLEKQSTWKTKSERSAYLDFSTFSIIDGFTRLKVLRAKNVGGLGHKRFCKRPRKKKRKEKKKEP